MRDTVTLEVKYTVEQGHGYFTVTTIPYQEDGLGSIGMIEREAQLKDFIHDLADELYDMALEMRDAQTRGRTP